MIFSTRFKLPYETYESSRSPAELRTGKKLEDLYHRGQKKAWDGPAVFEEVLAEHGPIRLEKSQADALGNIFSIIYWGELAAWKVSASLAELLESPEAAMAATSQAHDEARHFAVIGRYLKELGHDPGRLTLAAESILVEVMDTRDLCRKLMGMQLMIEPIALTIFQLIRRSGIEPVLGHLLPYLERDEARHVALGVVHLPQLLAKLSKVELTRLFAWQFRMYMHQVDGVMELHRDIETLGFSLRETFHLGQKLQFQAANELMEAMGGVLRGRELMAHLIEARLAWSCPEPGEPTDIARRLGRVAHCLVRGPDSDRRADLFGVPA
jgi:hypothetical protein